MASLNSLREWYELLFSDSILIEQQLRKIAMRRYWRRRLAKIFLVLALVALIIAARR